MSSSACTRTVAQTTGPSGRAFSHVFPRVEFLPAFVVIRRLSLCLETILETSSSPEYAACFTASRFLPNKIGVVLKIQYIKSRPPGPVRISITYPRRKDSVYIHRR